MPCYCGNTPCWPRGYWAMIFLVMALGLHLASVLTPVVKQKVDGVMSSVPYTRKTDVHLIKTWYKFEPGQNSIGIKETKEKGDTKDFIAGGCKKVSDFVQVIRAMFFSALGFCALAIVAGLINAVAKIPSMVTTILILMALICGLIGWAIAFAMWHKHYCNNGRAWKNVEGSKIGPSAPCLTAAWVLEWLALIFTCACEKGMHDVCGGGGDKDDNSSKYDNGTNRGAAGDDSSSNKGGNESAASSQNNRNYVDNVWYPGAEANVETPPKPGNTGNQKPADNYNNNYPAALPGHVDESGDFEGARSPCSSLAQPHVRQQQLPVVNRSQSHDALPLYGDKSQSGESPLQSADQSKSASTQSAPVDNDDGEDDDSGEEQAADVPKKKKGKRNAKTLKGKSK